LEHVARSPSAREPGVGVFRELRRERPAEHPLRADRGEREQDVDRDQHPEQLLLVHGSSAPGAGPHRSAGSRPDTTGAPAAAMRVSTDYAPLQLRWQKRTAGGRNRPPAVVSRITYCTGSVSDPPRLLTTATVPALTPE